MPNTSLKRACAAGFMAATILVENARPRGGREPAAAYLLSQAAAPFKRLLCTLRGRASPSHPPSGSSNEYEPLPGADPGAPADDEDEDEDVRGERLQLQGAASF